MMKQEEFKLRVVQLLKSLIDTYFGENNVVDKMTNATLKVLLDTNNDKMDGFISMFADKNGCIDAETVVYSYVAQIPMEGMKLDIKEYIDNDFVKGILPNKSLIIKKEDLLRVIDSSPIA